jgi:hypothetical protein
VNVPAEDQWGAWSTDLDAKSAHESFAGRSLEEAKALFRENVLWHTGELRSMPPIPFRFYVLAFMEYVLSPATLEDECEAADAASCFVHLVESKLRAAKADIEPVIATLLPAVAYVCDHQPEYGAQPEIYGDFADLHARIRALL